MTQVNGYTDDVLAHDDATGVAEKIQQQTYTALDATKAAIARIEKVNPTLNGMAFSCFTEAMLDAQRHNQGEFSGVPSLIKDNIDVKGLPTQQGATAFKPKTATQTDPIAKQFLAQGFTLLGKTTLPEFGFSGTTEYQDGSHTKNPWHTDYSSGGSSGGSGALVAAGSVPIAHGNDGGGSIRIPASACGLVGLKSSRERLPVSNLAKQLPVNMIADGVLSRSVRDTANFMAAAEQYYHHPKFPPIGRVTGANKQRLRIGLITDAITGEPICDDSLRTLEETVTLLEKLGHTVIPTRIPIEKEFIAGFLNYYGFMGFATATFGKLVFGRSFDAKKLDPLSKGLRKYYQRHFMQTPSAVKMYWHAMRIFKENMRDLDVLLSPVTAYASPKLGYLSPNVPYDTLMQRLTHYGSFTALHNVLGTPAISVPLGFTSEDKRPLGMQFASSLGKEKMLLELAFELEEAQPFTHLYQK